MQKLSDQTISMSDKLAHSEKHFESKQMAQNQNFQDQLKQQVEHHHSLQLMITAEETLRKTQINSLHVVQQKIEQDLEKKGQHLLDIFELLNNESSKFKEFIQSNDARLKNEQASVDHKIKLANSLLKQIIIEDVSAFTDTKCQILQDQIQNLQPQDTRPLHTQHTPIFSNANKFKDFIDERLLDLTRTYLKESQEFASTLKLLVEVDLRPTKQHLEIQLLKMSETRKEFIHKLDLQSGEMSKIHKWLSENESHIEASVLKNQQSCLEIQAQFLQMQGMKTQLDIKMQSINTQGDTLDQIMRRLQFQQVQIKSDQEIQNNYLNGQLQHIIKDKTLINMKTDKMLSWLTHLSEALNVALCVSLSQSIKSSDFLAIPTFLDGILFQNHQKQDQLICYRMNLAQPKELLTQTLIVLQHNYTKLNKQLNFTFTCQELYNAEILPNMESKQKLTTELNVNTEETDHDKIHQQQFLEAKKLKRPRTLLRERAKRDHSFDQNMFNSDDQSDMHHMIYTTINQVASSAKRRIHSHQSIDENKIKGSFLNPHKSTKFQASLKRKMIMSGGHQYIHTS